ncbi:hypothetical protein GOBAR_AA36098 [Gossypium barbadense]|uniref:Uncharacterized protein n=1 Tax=Gossypium barbadense TaxID=3634 RepID=A0A2P5W0J0_GOSBA|nr:hypothetical protein GOBAR_AA36098 [Gossypium barbadense]
MGRMLEELNKTFIVLIPRRWRFKITLPICALSNHDNNRGRYESQGGKEDCHSKFKRIFQEILQVKTTMEVGKCLAMKKGMWKKGKFFQSTANRMESQRSSWKAKFLEQGEKLTLS